MKTVAVRTIKRTDPDTTKALGHAGVSTVHEAQGRIGLMKPYMRPIYAGARLAGRQSPFWRNRAIIGCCMLRSSFASQAICLLSPAPPIMATDFLAIF